jgi:hypothetical protein
MFDGDTSIGMNDVGLGRIDKSPYWEFPDPEASKAPGTFGKGG